MSDQVVESEVRSGIVNQFRLRAGDYFSHINTYERLMVLDWMPFGGRLFRRTFLEVGAEIRVGTRYYMELFAQEKMAVVPALLNGDTVYLLVEQLAPLEFQPHVSLVRF